MGNQQHDGFLKPDLRRVLTSCCRLILSLCSDMNGGLDFAVKCSDMKNINTMHNPKD